MIKFLRFAKDEFSHQDNFIAMVLQNGWYIWVSAKHLKLVLPLIPIQILN
jgi:hypothetical protein